MTSRLPRADRPLSPALRLSLSAALLLVASCASSGSSSSRPGAAGIGDPYYPNAGNGGYDVQHYDLEFDVDLAGGTLAGRTVIEAVATQSLSTLNLDFQGYEVRESWVDRRPAAILRDGAELVVRPAEPIANGASFRVTIVYDGEPRLVADPAVPFAPGVGWDQRDDSVYVVSQPTGAHGYFPCSDHPSDKATYSVRVAVPEGYTVAANGTPAGTGWKGGKQVWSFASRDPMATYLVTVAIDRFEVVEEPGPSGLVLRHYFPEGTEPERRAPFAATTDILEFFAEHFGPYPFESCGGILARREDLGGALETQTLPVYGWDAGQEYVIAHELAHQWFGNDVALERWSDIWLNEGVAEYLALLWVREDQGREAYLERLARLDMFVRARSVGPPLDPGVEHLFSAQVYLRGSLAAFALHEAVGDETFYATLRTFHERHAGGTANIEDFYAVVEELGGADARALLVRWLTDPTPPPLPQLEGLLDEGADSGS